ncbi:amidohydrolase family protein [Nakamurella sp.]|uniref:amidohydrolase family protein n=1 Tax=Nakamurella sp. TaxID=1869182 RepID=UPI003B3B8202
MFDSHLHIIDPRFPLIPNQGSGGPGPVGSDVAAVADVAAGAARPLSPAASQARPAYRPDPFTVDDYRRVVDDLGVRGGAVVSGSFQGFDQTYLLDALDRLGPTFVGVTQLPADTTAGTITRLDAAGVRAVRFNLVRGGSAGPDDVDRLGRLVYDTAGWSSEFYVRSDDLGSVGPAIGRLPRASIDHLGLTTDGLDDLLRLVAGGVRVKATGFGRWAGGPAVVVDVLRRIHGVDPGALLWGTDLPGTRAPRPFVPADLEVLADAVGADLDRVLTGNAVGWYRPTGGLGGAAPAGAGGPVAVAGRRPRPSPGAQ